MRTRMRVLLPALALLVFCGCLDYTDKLTINADGSGAVQIKVVTTGPTEMLEMMSMGAGEEAAAFPPLSKRAAAKMFPANNFEVSFSSSDESETNQFTIEAKFKDIAALLNSRYAESRGLTLKVEGDKLLLSVKSGLEATARAANSEQAEQMRDALSNVPGQKNNTNGAVKFRFEVVMPGAVAESNGAKSGNAATWTIEKGKLDGKQLADKLSETMTANCPASAIKFTPTTPVRLALQNFNELATNTVKASASVDVEKVKAAAKFVPYSVHVTRSLDLAGSNSGMQENAAVLTGAIVIPAALTPQQWGEVKLQEAKDAKGKSLIPSEEGEESHRFSRYSYSYSDDQAEGDDDDEEDSDNGSAKKPAKKATQEARHTATVTFNPPQWQSTEIARIKATAALLYFGGSQIVKLANAIPAKSIMNMEGDSSSFTFNEDTERKLSDPKLTQLGLKLKVDNAMQQKEMLHISMEAEGKNTVISGLQIYDADGKPWPTTLNKNDMGDSTSFSVTVSGRPKAPLSMALLVPDAMTKVEVPILLENVPVRGKSK